jgi:hypothetical protein
MAKQKSWLETIGSEIKAGIKKVLSYGSFEPNYIANRAPKPKPFGPTTTKIIKTK